MEQCFCYQLFLYAEFKARPELDNTLSGTSAFSKWNFLIYGSVLLSLYNRSQHLRCAHILWPYNTFLFFKSPAKNIRLRTCHSVSDNVDTETALYSSCLIRNLIFTYLFSSCSDAPSSWTSSSCTCIASSCARFSLICCASARISSAFSCTVVAVFITQSFARSTAAVQFVYTFCVLTGKELYTRSPKYDSSYKTSDFSKWITKHPMYLLIICVYSLYRIPSKAKDGRPRLKLCCFTTTSLPFL